jgi:hypothetical protein
VRTICIKAAAHLPSAAGFATLNLPYLTVVAHPDDAVVASGGRAGVLLAQLRPQKVLRRVHEGVVSIRRYYQRMAALDYPKSNRHQVKLRSDYDFCSRQ